MEVNVEYVPNEKQFKFHESNSDEVVYGGAKGGGKSCALVMECLAYGLEYPGANMYIFRETYDDLEANIIREWKEKVPKELYKYNDSKHQVTLNNGTSVKFRFIRNYSDAEGYQGRSMDWIGVDELTKHLKKSIQVLLSCLRSPKGYPPRFRATCNPGGIGHGWVKAEYIQATDYGKHKIKCRITDSIKEFIPARVYDNVVLMENDPNYVKRLENLPEDKKKAFLYGDWDIFEGQHFEEFDKEVHVIEPFAIPKHWDRYSVLDYGLDMLAGLWVTVNEYGKGFIYKDVNEAGLIISRAAEKMIDINNGDEMMINYAPGDLWNRRQETGMSAFDIFVENNWIMIQADRNRENGSLAMKEWLKIYDSVDEQTGKTIRTANLKIFSNCKELINNLTEIQSDEKNPNCYATTPHEITHNVDALRYFCIMRQGPSEPIKEELDYEEQKEYDDYEELEEEGFY